MIPAAVIVGVLIGVIIGLAAAGVYHARTIAPPVERRASWTAVGGNASAESIDAEWQQNIFRQMAKGRLFDIRRVL